MLFYLDNARARSDSRAHTRRCAQVRDAARMRAAAASARSARAERELRARAARAAHARRGRRLHAAGRDRSRARAHRMDDRTRASGRRASSSAPRSTTPDAEGRARPQARRPGAASRTARRCSTSSRAQSVHGAVHRHASSRCRFVSDNPPQALVERAAQTFTRTDGDIREVVRTIVTSPEFFAARRIRAR